VKFNFSYDIHTEDSIRFRNITLHFVLCWLCTVVAGNMYMLSIYDRIRESSVGIVSGLGIGEATYHF
jgi:uncharacterized membrane protein